VGKLKGGKRENTSQNTGGKKKRPTGADLSGEGVAPAAFHLGLR